MHTQNTNEHLWTLYGTKDCHLCETAEYLLSQCADAYPIAWQHVDIAELPEAHHLKLAKRIPALATAHETLYWPFSLADLAKLAHAQAQKHTPPPISPQKPILIHT